MGKKVIEIKLIQSEYAMPPQSILDGHGEFSKSNLMQSAGHCDSEIPSGKNITYLIFIQKKK